MAYSFVTSVIGKARIVDDQNAEFTISGVNAQEEDAEVIFSGVNTLLSIVGWQAVEVTRIVEQVVTEE